MKNKEYKKKLVEFKTLVESHDLLYSYSDDYAMWTQGAEERRKIYEYMERINHEDAIGIWNENVKLKLSQKVWAEFLME